MASFFCIEKRNKMDFTVVVENTLNGVQLEFDSHFGVDACFEESDSMLFLVCKYLKIEEGKYNSVEEVIAEFSDELEDCVEIVEIKDFPIYCKTASFVVIKIPPLMFLILYRKNTVVNAIF